MNELFWKRGEIEEKQTGQFIQNGRMRALCSLYKELKVSKRSYIILSQCLFVAIYFKNVYVILHSLHDALYVVETQ